MPATLTLKRAILVALLWNFTGDCAGAEDAGASMFSFDGFGTLGVVHSSEDKADFTTSPFEATGAGHTSNWSASVDSLIGAQVIANVSSKLSAVVQAISEQNYDHTWTPHVEWANIKWQVTPDFNIRAGRTAPPQFMFSQIRNVGYANIWVRLPVEVYGLVPLTTNDGVDTSYRFVAGAASDTVRISAGRTDAKFPATEGRPSSTLQARRVVVVSDSYERGFTTLHFSYSQTRVTIPGLNGLFNAFRQFGSQGKAIADRYDVDDALFTFLDVGVVYDPGNWFAMGEWARENTHSALGEKTGWYVNGGYRFKKFTPYATYARLKAESSTFDPGLTVAGLPPALAIPAAGLNAALNSILGSVADQKTISAGLRWDFVRNVDLTLQFDHTRLGAGSPGTLSNIQPGFQPGSSFNLLSVAIDFVF